MAGPLHETIAMYADKTVAAWCFQNHYWWNANDRNIGARAVYPVHYWSLLFDEALIDAEARCGSRMLAVSGGGDPEHLSQECPAIDGEQRMIHIKDYPSIWLQGEISRFLQILSVVEIMSQEQGKKSGWAEVCCILNSNCKRAMGLMQNNNNTKPPWKISVKIWPKNLEKPFSKISLHRWSTRW